MSFEPHESDDLENEPLFPPVHFTLTPEQEAKMIAANRRADEMGERQLAFERVSEMKFGGMFKSGRDYAVRTRKTTPWVVEGLLPEGYLAILGGTSKAGKTCFAHALAMSVASGTPFLGMPVWDGAVLWCAYEESEGERLQIMRQWPEHPKNFYITHEKLHIDNPDELEAIAYWVYKTDAKLIVIDPLLAATEAEGLNDGRVARRVLSGLKEVCRKQGCAALVLHHINKDVSAGMVRERFAESGQLLATASMDMLMTGTELPQGGRMLQIACRGRGEFTNRTLMVRSDSVTHYEMLSDLPPPASMAEHRETAILRALNNPEGMTSSNIARTLGMNIQTVRNCLTRLTNNGKVCLLPRSGRAALYALQLHS